MSAHPFTPDPKVPADPYSGRRVCAWPSCGLPEANRVHTLPDVPEQQESRRRAGDVEPRSIPEGEINDDRRQP